MRIELATESDVEQLAHLVNTCYRGEKSWTYDGGLILGPRTTPNFLRKRLAMPGYAIIKCSDDDNVNDPGKIIACVLVEQDGLKLYMEMLSVHAKFQSRGLGGKMMKAVEDHAKQTKVKGIHIKVVNTQKELFAWYERIGFKITGKLIPFPEPEAGYGESVIPLVLVEMVKPIVD